MKKNGKTGAAAKSAGMKQHRKKSGAAIFCLGLCLTLLLVSAIALFSPLGQGDASARMESRLDRLAQAEAAPPEPEAAPEPDELAGIDPCWHPLLERLKEDDVHGADVQHWFASLSEAYSQRPMGVKVSTLFKRRFVPPYFPYFNKPVKSANIYAGVVTKDNIRKCYDFLSEYNDIFQKAEKTYFVPKEVLVSLLMVETRLGNFMGSEKAFWSLACMASAGDTDSIGSYLEKLPVTDEHEDWLTDILKARSDWAYAELKALISYCRLHEHDPLQITGSIYGAIGLCQFMPSNIPSYAVDGNGDGKIDLFSLEDAVPSAANFLKNHGWKKGTSGKKRVRLLKYYNHSTAYANTILGLSDGVTKLAKNEAKKQAAAKKQTAAKKANATPAKKS